MKTLYKILPLIFLTVFGADSCKKFVAIPVSPQLISTAAIFTNDNTATSAVQGVYTWMRQASPSFENGAISIYAGLSADEIVNTTSNAAYNQFYQDAIPSNSGTISSTFWSVPYNTIYRTNAILTGLASATALTDSVKRQLTGEMMFVRALTYFYLTNLYGDVPLITTPAYQQSSVTPRTASAKVYQQMVTDLLGAQALLGDTYVSTGKARPNKETATALLARVYLYQDDWQDAEAQATKVIGSNIYNLVTDLNSVFLEDSNETIWEIASPSESRNSAEGTTFIPFSPSSKPIFMLNPNLFNAFETGDLREADWLNSSTVSGTVYYYPYKYKNRANTPVTEYEVVLRLAEQYLIRAEAEANGAGAGANGAVADLNAIRSRAGLPNYSGATDKASLLTAIAHERQVELFTEWGNRWLDLKRSATIDAVLSVEKTGWHSYEALYPIPYSQIQYNPFLTQNPGYN